MANQRRFLYNAKAVGVGDGLEAWASAALPLIGGEAYAEVGPVKRASFEFRFAETTLIGRQVRPGVFETIATVTVRELNILNGLIRCPLATVTVNTTYERNGTLWTTNLSPVHPFTGLTIIDKNFDGVELETDLAHWAARDFGGRFAKEIGDRRRDAHFRHPPGDPRGAIFTTLAKEDVPSAGVKLASTPREHGFLNLAVEGMQPIRIHFCEWSAEPDRRSLALMRVVLADGSQIIIGDPDDNGKDP